MRWHTTHAPPHAHHLRPETQPDFRLVEELTRQAFWNLYTPGCHEHYLVHILREHPDFVRELDFVAELDGRLVGSILYTRAWLVDDAGSQLDILSFGPISVLPEFQRQGIGSALIRHTVPLARGQGAPAIVILGDPHNYCKHGFRSARDLNISDQNGDYPYGMLALELLPGALAGRRWKYRYSPVYELDEAAAEAFDRDFPPREKAYQYSQEIFSIAFRSYVR